MQEIIENISTKEDFLTFLEHLMDDYINNRESWENQDLESYLDAMHSWTEDMEGYYENLGICLSNDIPWKIFANILVAAKMYE